MTSNSRDESPIARLTAAADRRRRGVRRAVLARRRPLAALLTATAVFVGVRATASPAPETTMIAVAEHDLAPGAQLDAKDVRAVEWPADLVPAGVVALADVDGRTVAAPVPEGEPLTRERLVGRALTGEAGSSVLPVRLPDPAVVALLRPGDAVDLLAVDPESGTTETVTDGAVVLAVPPDPPDDGGLSGRVVMMSVDSADASAVASAAVRRFLTLAYDR